MKYFETILLDEAKEFVVGLHPIIQSKILSNIKIAQERNDSSLFKKLQNEIWEFRTSYFGIQFRILAFWDKSDNKNTLVLATHGFKKKVDKVPGKEIIRAENIRAKYYDSKINF